MKTRLALAALLALAVAPSEAQEPDESVRLELAELEQDVDKTLLREAMLLLGRKALVPSSERPTSDEDRKREAEDARQLEEYIQRKKQALIQRSAELKKIRGMATTADSKPDRQRLIEEIEKVQVEVGKLQGQVQMYQRVLKDAINTLAEAEVLAVADPSQEEKVHELRKKL